MAWRADLDRRIEQLVRLRDELTTCIGCGCLSLDTCALSNPHDELDPDVSALIIQEHVTDGITMARSFRLPPEIVEGIATHHGTTLVTYFYRRALENAKPGDDVYVSGSLVRAASRAYGVIPEQRIVFGRKAERAYDGAWTSPTRRPRPGWSGWSRRSAAH